MTTKEMYEMWERGITYQKIADEAGITKQAVYQRLLYYRHKIIGFRGKGFNINTIVYQGIYDWFKENFDASLYSLVYKVFGHSDGATMTRFRYFLIGKHDSHFKIEHIKRLCEITGKPFEEVFKRRDAK